MTSQTILGIYPGADGAIALLYENGDLLDLIDMPSMPEANGRTATNAPLLAGILARTHARIAFCEFVGARPTDAKVAAFAFGRARGVIEGCAGINDETHEEALDVMRLYAPLIRVVKLGDVSLPK